MLTTMKIFNQINRLTTDLIQTGLCDAQNFPSLKRHSGNIEEIGIRNTDNLDNSIFLRNMSYSDMYKQLITMGKYNIKMIDGALISMSYRFDNNHLIKHRLSFFPSPDLEMFQNEPDIYIMDELYSDIIDKRIVAVPIRFDFDKRVNAYKPIEHPISHLTLGQYKNCRIPVVSALTPYQFLSFIVLNFYHTAYKKYSNYFTLFTDCFETTIFAEEREVLHIHTPAYMAH